MMDDYYTKNTTAERTFTIEERIEQKLNILLEHFELMDEHGCFHDWKGDAQTGYLSEHCTKCNKFRMAR